MKTLIIRAVICTLLVSGVSQALAAKPSLKDAFIGITEKQLRKEYTQLAMAPIAVAESLAIPDSMRTLIETEILETLKDEDFNILPPAEIQRIQDQFTALYTSPAATEKEQNERLDSISEHAYRELYFQHPVNGLVTVHVTAVGAPFVNDKASWHGTSQKVKHSGDGLFKAISGGGNYTGTIYASSIKVTISNRMGAVIYHWAGGIEVLMERKGSELKIKPATTFWQDKKRVKKAIKYALKPF